MNVQLQPLGTTTLIHQHCLRCLSVGCFPLPFSLMFATRGVPHLVFVPLMRGSAHGLVFQAAACFAHVARHVAPDRMLLLQEGTYARRAPIVAAWTITLLSRQTGGTPKRFPRDLQGFPRKPKGPPSTSLEAPKGHQRFPRDAHGPPITSKRSPREA